MAKNHGISIEPVSYINSVQEITAIASLHYEIWWVYLGQDTHELYSKVRNKYINYFFASEKAHISALIIGLYTLYEKRNDTYNIPLFMKLMRDRNWYSENAIKKFNSIYEEIKPLWIKVSILRNKIYGHKTLDKSVSEIFDSVKITPNQLKELLNKTKDLINEMNHELNRSTHAFNLIATNDTVRLLEDLSKKR